MKLPISLRLSLVFALLSAAFLIGLTLDLVHKREIELQSVRDSLYTERYSHNSDLIDWSNGQQILIDSIKNLNNGIDKVFRKFAEKQ
jgi:hypothetical protein